MCIRNEIILELINFVLIIIILVFILIDFGFNIEELVSAFTSALSSMALVLESVTNLIY
jgi:hypothetical protein